MPTINAASHTCVIRRGQPWLLTASQASQAGWGDAGTQDPSAGDNSCPGRQERGAASEQGEFPTGAGAGAGEEWACSEPNKVQCSFPAYGQAEFPKIMQPGPVPCFAAPPGLQAQPDPVLCPPSRWQLPHQQGCTSAEQTLLSPHLLLTEQGAVGAGRAGKDAPSSPAGL